MRSAILIADGKVVLGPVPASQAESEFKAAVRAGGNGAAFIELWSEDRGCEKRSKFIIAPAPAAEKPSKKKG
jgi:hypothetical protein